MHANKMNRGIFNPFMTEAVIIDWFLYDNGLRHERVNEKTTNKIQFSTPRRIIFNHCSIELNQTRQGMFSKIRTDNYEME